MNHLEEEQLLDAYYAELDAKSSAHLQSCPDCRGKLETLRDLLNAVRDMPVPERAPDYGASVWSRLLPLIPSRPAPRLWFRWWTLAPVVAALLVIAFFLGHWTAEHGPTRYSPEANLPHARERVLLLALSEHLERSQVLLTEVLHQPAAETEWADQRKQARDLLDENRLLRQTAVLSGDKVHAALLEELERTLLDLANSDGEAAPGQLDAVQHRIEDQNLLWKVRIVSSDARQEGQKL